MRILTIATKSPWPPNDGGRLVLDLCLDQLVRAGHEVRLVAPCEPEHLERRRAAIPAAMRDARLLPLAPRPWPGALWSAFADGVSASVARHRHEALRTAVGEAAADFQPEVIHVEQLQALANVPAAVSAQRPMLLRMHNVESALWRQAPWPGRWLAAGVCRDERAAMARAYRTVCLTQRDALALGELADPAHRERVIAVPPGFPAILPAGPEQPGEPALALAGSAGWRPNADAAHWFMTAVWPHIARAFPRARLHLFGGRAGGRVNGVESHPAPVDSLSAFPLNGLCVVPLHSGSGIRMRILEAWARGLPVIATTVAARGLDVVSGRELVIADSAEQFVSAIERLTHDAGFRQALIAAGRDYLCTRHDPAAAADALTAAYRAAIASHASESPLGKTRT